MKKTFLALATIGLFAASLLFSFSSDSNGRFHFFKKANAFNLQYSYYAIPCPDNSGNYAFVCGPGSYDICTSLPCP